MAQIRTGKDAVSLVAATFFASASLDFLLPVPCYLLVTYPLPTEPIFTLFTAFHTKFLFPRFLAQKYRNPLKIAVFSSLPAYSFTKYL